MNREKLIDLDKEQLALLDEIIKRHIPNKPVWAYGSRVTWKASEISDLDLVVFDCDPTEVFNLKEAFVESDLLISVDVMDWESIPEKFKENIKNQYVVLQGKTNLEGWREVKLGDVADINPTESISKGAKLPKVLMDFLVPFTKRIPKYVIGAYKGGSKFKNGDTLVARITPCLENGKTSFVDFLDNGKVGFGSTEFIVFRERKNITNKHFLYYLAISNNFREVAIKSMTGTSGRQRVQTDEVFEYNFSLPPLPEQKAIAEVLSSLDDKIDLLRRQNKTLENIAQTLFRQWFVEEADEGWDVKKLEDIANISSGKGLKNSEYVQNGGYAIMGANGEIGRTDKYLFDEKLIFTGRVGTHGKVFISNGKVWISDNTLIIKPKNNLFYFIYFLLKNSRLERLNVGSTQPLIRQSDLKNIELLLPDQEMLFTFENQTNDVFSKIEYNRSRIRTLENLRDTLLPKLMSGTVKVKH